MPVRIVADRIDDRPAPDTVAPGNLCWQARQGHEGIHIVRMLLSPDPGLHTPHRGAHDESGMIDTQPFSQQPKHSGDHVGVTVMGKARMQTIARLARLAVPDAIGHHDEILCGIQRLTWPEQLAGEWLAQKSLAAAAGTVTNEDGIAHHALGIPNRLPKRAVVDSQLPERLSGGEPEIPHDVIAFRGGHRGWRGGNGHLDERHAGDEAYQASRDALHDQSRLVRFRESAL